METVHSGLGTVISIHQGPPFASDLLRRYALAVCEVVMPASLGEQAIQARLNPIDVFLCG